ncbi:ApaG protein [Sinobacterium caligoides]|uniref:Protein ApaG n=1 Tax=Sinobacterium caligoides TaxID=933926 RepID=A0A3N2DPI4_9GAMM|nr:Co2+/Mg2+ efflux protein ApaG [Sinobacterium caligoides]ROS01549.1 ApaG protein [Sinobacterium caligoides]
MNYPITIEVISEFLTEQSDPRRQRFAFNYQVKITNNGDESIQLLSRYWQITDGNNSIKEVHGSGVIGLQPYIAAGESFEYISAATLDTEVGSMQGYYQMITDSGQCFDAPISAFQLAVPMAVH